MFVLHRLQMEQITHDVRKKRLSGLPNSARQLALGCPLRTCARLTLLHVSAMGRITLQRFSNRRPCAIPRGHSPPPMLSADWSVSSSSAPVSLKRNKSFSFAWVGQEVSVGCGSNRAVDLGRGGINATQGWRVVCLKVLYLL